MQKCTKLEGWARDNLRLIEFCKSDDEQVIFVGDTTTFYGTQLAINSSGKWVMEIKGSGNVVAIDPAIIEEVVPHTVDVQFFGSNTQNYSYWAPAGKYAVNDLLLINGHNGLAIVLVTKVDTKSKKANKDLPVVGKIALDTAITN